jgi:hypothetical protein
MELNRKWPRAISRSRWIFFSARTVRAFAEPIRDASSYRLKNVHAAIAIKTTAMIQRDELLIPVFFAMRRFLPRKPAPRKENVIRRNGREQGHTPLVNILSSY